MKVNYCGKLYVAMDYIYKGGKVDVLILDPPLYGKRWISVPYSDIIKEPTDTDNL